MTALICGVVRFDGEAAGPAVSAMLAAMRPAGKPVAEALGGEGAAVFGQIRIGPNGDWHPGEAEVIEDGEALAVGDARFYPRGGAPAPDCLRAALAAPGFPAGLHGDFAVAVWRDGQLTLWRDHLGVRPLFLVHEAGRFAAFASTPGALLAAGLAVRRLDPEVMLRMALYPRGDGPRTWFAGIRRVRAAERLTLGQGGLRARRYWRPRPEGRWRGSMAEAGAELRARLDRAVRRRLVPGAPGAGHLSGGLDSTSVAVLAARALGDGGETFAGYCFRSAADAGGAAPPDEGIGLDAIGVPALRIVDIDQPGLHRVLRGGVGPDSGVLVSPLNPDQAAAADAAFRGAPVFLTGWGGDHGATYPGQAVASDMALRLRWRALAALLGVEAARHGRSLPAMLRGRVVARLLPPGLRRRIARLRRNVRDREAAERRVIAGHRRAAAPLRGDPTRALSRADRAARLAGAMLPDTLEDFALMGAPHGVAYAHPLLDLDLLGFVLSLPGEFFAAGAERRIVFREAMRGVLPEPIRNRPQKRLPYPLEAIRLAEDRDWLLAEIAALGQIGLVQEYLDLAPLAETVAAWPDAAAIRAALAAGDPIRVNWFGHLNPLIAAGFLEANAALGAR